MRFIIAMWWCFFIPAWLSAQTAIVGKVVTHRGEAVSLVHIFCVENQQKVVTDSTGFFRMECPIPCTLQLSHVSYNDENYRLTEENAPFVIVLRNKSNNLNEIFVTGFPTSGSIFSSHSNIERIPAILGEQDILKYLATLPGIITTNPFNAGIYVRGGNSHENGFLVNDMLIANPDHLTGILSTFDPYVLSNSTLYKSGFPARYNSYLSSYLNMRPDSDHKQKHSGEVALGLVSSSFKAKGPVFKKSTSYALAVRSSYLQQIARLYNENVGDHSNSTMPEYAFSDITANISSRLSDKWRINAFGLFTIDRLKMEISDQVQYLFNWHTLSGNTSAYYIPRSTDMWTIQVGAKTAFSEGSASGNLPMGGGNRYYALLSRLSYSHRLSDHVRMQSGVKYEHNRFETAQREDGYGNALIKSSDKKFNLFDLHTDIDFHLNNNITINGGINYQFYQGETRRHTLSPRLKISYSAGEHVTLWADYAKTTQYLSLYPYFTVKTPVDIWYPLGKENRPAVCHQYSVGTSGEISAHLSVYAGLFYKKMNHVKDFIYESKTEYSILSDKQIEGNGDAKGMEIDLSFNHRKLYARANYTLSESKRRFAEINDGKAFFPPYDVKHNIVLNLSYEFSPQLVFNTLWTFSSGVYTTFPEGVVVAHNISDILDRPVFIPIYKDRYNYRLPNNHRLDANLDYSFIFRQFVCKLSAGAYNIYNQSNPSFVYFQPIEERSGLRFAPKSKVTLPFIPYFSLRFKW